MLCCRLSPEQILNYPHYDLHLTPAIRCSMQTNTCKHDYKYVFLRRTLIGRGVMKCGSCRRKFFPCRTEANHLPLTEPSP